MVAMEHKPSLLGAIAYWLNEKGKAKSLAASNRKVAKEARSRLQQFVRIVFIFAGFGCLTFAGFLWTMIAGLVVAGISCFFLSWLTTGTSTRKTDEQ